MPVGDEPLEDGRDGIDERDLDVEDEKDERGEVEARVEVEPRAEDRLLARLVRLELGPLRRRSGDGRGRTSFPASIEPRTKSQATRRNARTVA